MGFLSYNSGSRHARRSIKGSKDAEDHLVSTKTEPNIWLIGLASKARQNWSKSQKHALFVTSPRENPKCKSKN